MELSTIMTENHSMYRFEFLIFIYNNRFLRKSTRNPHVISPYQYYKLKILSISIILLPIESHVIPKAYSQLYSVKKKIRLEL